MHDSKLSLIIPTSNEKNEGYLAHIAMQYPRSKNIQYIIVDFKTNPEVLNNLNRDDFEVHHTNEPNRAGRINIGIEHTRNTFVLVNHPRSIIAPKGIDYIMQNSSSLTWGGFTHKFDESSPGLRWTSWYSNAVRPKLFKIIYLDHCIFFHRRFLTSPIPNIPIFEDTELSLILSNSGSPQILPFLSTTSAIRFRNNGFWKQALMNQKLKIKYHLGRSPQKMNDEYEKNLNLNS